MPRTAPRLNRRNGGVARLPNGGGGPIRRELFGPSLSPKTPVGSNAMQRRRGISPNFKQLSVADQRELVTYFKMMTPKEVKATYTVAFRPSRTFNPSQRAKALELMRKAGKNSVISLARAAGKPVNGTQPSARKKLWFF